MTDLSISPLAAALRVEMTPVVQVDPVDGPSTPQTEPGILPEPSPGAAAPAPPPMAQVLNLATQIAATRQDGAAPLLANLTQLLQNPTAPPALRMAMANLLSLMTPLSATTPPADIARAFSQSGLLLEARLGQDPARSPADVKAALLNLQAVASRLLVQSADPHTHAPSVAPPLHGGPLAAQAANPLAPGDASRLTQQTSAALARQQLLQFASLPQNPVSKQANDALAWMFDIPFATPRGPAVGQFEISRDGRRAGSDGPAPPWQVRFAIDVEPAGPVQAHVTLATDHSRVVLWAERPRTQVALQREKTALSLALNGAEISVYPGAPSGPTPVAGGLVDRQT